MQMIKIIDCTVVECAYNREIQCHAAAITVGSDCAKCETYLKGENSGGGDEAGAVGACHQAECKFNRSLECYAPGIRVGIHEGHADCKTYNTD